jgi:hypothetical protein
MKKSILIFFLIIPILSYGQIKISQLTEATNLNYTDLFLLNQGSVSKKLQLSNLQYKLFNIVPYALRLNYSSDSLRLGFKGDSTKFETSQPFYAFDKPIFQLGSRIVTFLDTLNKITTKKNLIDSAHNLNLRTALAQNIKASDTTRWALGGGSGVSSVSGTDTRGAAWSITNPTTTPNLHLAFDSTAIFQTRTQSRADTLKLHLEIAAKENMIIATTDIYVDGNRTDSYTADGSINRPYKTLDAVFTVTPTTPIAIHLAPATYTQTTDVTFPNVSIVIFGNNSTLDATGHTITVTNPNYARYNLFTIASNVTFNNFSSGARCLMQGGGITGNITINSYCEFTQCQLNGGTITVGNTGQAVVTLCSPTSKFVSTGSLTLERINMNTSYAGYLVTSTAGQLTVSNSLFYNLNTGSSAGVISCNNGATTLPNFISNNVLVNSGSTQYCLLSGTAATVYSKNYVYGAHTVIGSLLAPVSSDMTGAGNVMALGSDATGDIYYRNSLGLLTRIALGTNGQVLQSNGTIPGWATPSGGSSTLQQAYNNSTAPQITTSLGKLQIKDGNTGIDTVFSILNVSGSTRFSVRGEGDIKGRSLIVGGSTFVDSQPVITTTSHYNEGMALQAMNNSATGDAIHSISTGGVGGYFQSTSGIGASLSSNTGNALYSRSIQGISGVFNNTRNPSGGTHALHIAEFQKDAVNKAIIDTSGNVDITGQYRINGVPIGTGGTSLTKSQIRDSIQALTGSNRLDANSLKNKNYIARTLSGNNLDNDANISYDDQTISAAMSMAFTYTNAEKGNGGMIAFIADGVTGHDVTFSNGTLIGGQYDNTANKRNVLQYTYMDSSPDEVGYAWVIGKENTNTWSDDSSRYAPKSFVNRTVLASPYKVSFHYFNNEKLPFTMTGDLHIGVDTTTTISGSSTIYTVLGLSGYKIYHDQPWSPNDTSNTNRIINTTTGMQYIWLGGAFSSGNYRRYKFSLIDSSSINGVPDAAPVFVSGRVYDNMRNKVKLLYNTSLYAGSVPATTDFSTSPSKTISNVSISGDTVIVTASTEFTHNNTVTISYTPGTNGIKHSSGGSSASSLTNQSVTNDIAQVQLSAPGSFAGTPVSQSRIDWSWNTVPNAVYYKLDTATTSGGTYATLSSTIPQSTTSYPLTGLHNNQTVYARISALADGDNYTTSTYATANATTSALTQLSTPTNGSITVVDSTQLTANVSSVDANASYVSLDYKQTSSGTWINYSSTLPRTTTNQLLTGLSQAIGYDTRWTAIGDGSTYSNSNASSTQSATTWGGYAHFVSAETNTTGDSAHIYFDKAMQASPSATGLVFINRGTKSVTRHATNTSRYDVAFYTDYPSDTTITVSYTPGTIIASDLGVLSAFSGRSVTNNTIITYDTDYQNIYNAFTNKPSSGLATAQNNFVVGLKSDGVWSKIIKLLIFAVHSNSGNEALINWKTPGTKNATTTYTPTFIQYEGFTGNSTSMYINSQFIPSSDGWTSTNMGAGFYQRNSRSISSCSNLGIYNGTMFFQIDPLIPETSTMQLAMCCISGQINVSINNSETKGFYFINRISNSSVEFTKNNNKTSFTQNSTTLSNIAVNILARNNNGTNDRFSSDQLSAVYFTNTLSDAEVGNLRDRLETLMDYMGTGVLP